MRVETWRPSPAWLRAEVLIVLALSLGRSAVYSLIALAQALAAGPLAAQQPAPPPDREGSA